MKLATWTSIIVFSLSLSAQKRPLTHQDYDSWRSIQNPHLSADGVYLGYALFPQEGDGEFVVRNLKTGKEWRESIGARPWYQGIEYFLALRRLGKEAYLFVYNGEPHGLRRRPNQKDYTVRLQEFFDHYLKGAPMPQWMEKGIPYVDKSSTTPTDSQ